MFLGYSTSSKAYKVYKKRTSFVKETVPVIFAEFDPPFVRKVTTSDKDNDLFVLKIIADGSSSSNINQEAKKERNKAKGRNFSIS